MRNPFRNNGTALPLCNIKKSERPIIESDRQTNRQTDRLTLRQMKKQYKEIF